LSDIVVRVLVRAHFMARNREEPKMKTDQPKSSTKFYTIEQIAECVDASTRTVRRWIEKGLLVAHRINGLVRISEPDFQAFLATHRDD
jgi:excisionase family DNA binding protein